LLGPRVNEVRDVTATVATHARRLAGDPRMLVGEPDSSADAIGQAARDDRIIRRGLLGERSSGRSRRSDAIGPVGS
jgi:hypothetical protein